MQDFCSTSSKIGDFQYCLSSDRRSFGESQKQCRSLHGDLATTENIETWKKIQDHAKTRNDYWIGFKFCKEKTFRKIFKNEECKNLKFIDYPGNYPLASVKLNYSLVLMFGQNWPSKPVAKYGIQHRNVKKHYVCQLPNEDRKDRPTDILNPTTKIPPPVVQQDNTGSSLTALYVILPLLLIVFLLGYFVFFRTNRGKRWFRGKKEMMSDNCRSLVHWKRRTESRLMSSRTTSRTTTMSRSGVQRQQEAEQSQAQSIEMENLQFHRAPEINEEDNVQFNRPASYASYDSFSSDDFPDSEEDEGQEGESNPNVEAEKEDETNKEEEEEVNQVSSHNRSTSLTNPNVVYASVNKDRSHTQIT